MSQQLSSDDARTGRPDADTLSGNGRSQEPSSRAAILLIDDNPAIARAIDIAFRIAGHALDTANGPEEAWSRLARRRYDAILLDMNFAAGAADGEEGLACLRRIIAEDASACVIVITAHSGIRIAVAAMQAGARDFVMKPWRNADLVAKVEAAMARGVSVTLRPRGAAADVPAVLIGESDAMHGLRALIARIGPTRASVTVTGPAGSGRTLAARAIHAASTDAADPIARIDLRADDWRDRLADAGSSVILRHPDRLDRLAQEMLVDRLPSALRCVAIADATDTLVPALRRRLATVEIAVPPLAARGDDMVRLARHFARDAAERFGRPAMTLTPAVEAMLRTTIWADEVRGLALAVERAVVLAEGGVIDAAALGTPTPGFAAPATDASFDLIDAERAMVEAALREHRHNVTHAAAALGLSRGALYRRMARHGL